MVWELVQYLQPFNRKLKYSVTMRFDPGVSCLGLIEWAIEQIKAIHE